MAPDSPYLALANFNVGVWRGRVTRVSPSTAEPIGVECAYVQEVRAEQRSDGLVLTSRTELDGSEAAPATDRLTASFSTDVDLDGTYSAEHLDGLDQVALWTPTTASDLIVEHSLAVSDDERKRCLLVYRAGGADGEADEEGGALVLQEAHLLVELRQPSATLADARGAEGGWLEPPAAAPATLMQLVGTWVGDASVRAPQRAPRPKAATTKRQVRGGGGARDRAAPSGFGAPKEEAPAKGGRGARLRRALFGAGAGETEAEGAPASVRTNVYKTRLAYAWDGAALVVRKLGVTAFGGDELDGIVSAGRLLTTPGAYSDYEAVSFEGGDPSQPALLLLPAGCHVLAPRRVAAGAPFSTEFGAVLAPGESFGWKGYSGGEGDGPLEDEEAAARTGAGVSDSASSRLVRVQRLYDGTRFVSGTTSLCSAE